MTAWSTAADSMTSPRFSPPPTRRGRAGHSNRRVRSDLTEGDRHAHADRDRTQEAGGPPVTAGDAARIQALQRTLNTAMARGAIRRWTYDPSGHWRVEAPAPVHGLAQRWLTVDQVELLGRAGGRVHRRPDHPRGRLAGARPAAGSRQPGGRAVPSLGPAVGHGHDQRDAVLRRGLRAGPGRRAAAGRDPR